jgi:hypothetical protein
MQGIAMCTRINCCQHTIRFTGRIGIILVACSLSSGCQINRAAIDPSVWKSHFGAEKSDDEEIRKAALEDDSFPSASQPVSSSS